MYIDFSSDWPAYVFMAVFLIFFVYIVVKGNFKEGALEVEEKNERKK